MRFRAVPISSAILVLPFLWCGGANAASGWDLRVLAPLCVGSCSFAEAGPLTIDSAGRVFGALPDSGVHGGGSVFELTKKPGGNKWTFRTIYNFCALLDCKDGQFPAQARLVIDDAGNLYGTTAEGGTRNNGVFFKLTPSGGGKNWKLTVLHNFCSRNSACTDGGAPGGPLAYEGQAQGIPYDGTSPIYGTAETFGAHDHGAVFSLQPRAGHEKWHETTLYSFCPKRSGPDCTDGESPYAVTLDAAGNLIGVAGGGVPVGFGHGGVLFKLSPVVGEKRWNENVIYTFCSQGNCADGYDPSAAPLLNQDGSLTGFTASGGANTAPECDGCGTIYRMTSDGTFSVLYNFCSENQCNDGAVPLGTPAVDDAGNIFGAAEAGGPGKNDFNHVGGGTVFEYSGSALTTLHAFCRKANCPDGMYPFPGVTMDGLGNLYGTTEGGGPNQTGEVFQMQHP